MLTIREEQPTDIAGIRHVNEQAFARPTEARLVDLLRVSCPTHLSLVATRGDTVVGHILFTPVLIDGSSPPLEGQGLAPMAVLPEYQRQGIGTQLVTTALATLEKAGTPFVVVLGHPEYYPRFGFVPASRWKIRSEYEGIPDEVFLIRVFNESALAGIHGVARYRQEFASAL